MDFSNNVPELFLKRIVSKSDFAIREELKSFSKRHGLVYQDVLYLATLAIIRDRELKSLMKTETFDSLLYDAIFWASRKEHKKNVRPKGVSEAQRRGKINLVVKLKKELIVDIFRRNKDNKLECLCELEKYLNLFFELSCIKRVSKKT